MGVIEIVETWWQTLGITAKQAVLVESAIDNNRKGSRPMQCEHCSQFYNSSNFHDCIGKFDELRWRLEGKVTNSMKARLNKKYGKSDQLQKMSENYLKTMHPKDYEDLEKAYKKKLKTMEENDPIWALEEELWEQ